jgi:hypothetical protein
MKLDSESGMGLAIEEVTQTAVRLLMDWNRLVGICL